MSVSSYLKQKFTSTPVLRFVFSILRGIKPVAVFGKTVIVTRYDDIVDILKREEDFTVHEIHGEKMDEMGSPFLLGMDASEVATRDRAISHKVVKREDLDKISVLMKEMIGEVLDKECGKGELDLVNDYARLISVRLVDRYFGVPADEAKMMEWQRAIFNQAFVNLADDPEIRDTGKKAATEISAHLYQLIEERQNSQPLTEDNILNRLIAEQEHNEWLDTEAVKRNILAILGVVENSSKVVCHIIDQLLRKPKFYAMVKAAADANDVDLVRKYCFDILRFNPHNPIIIRFCKEGAIVGAGTKHAKKIKPGRTIYAATLSGMFDKRKVSNPRKIDPERKVDYIHFGSGPHKCLGTYVSYVSVSEMVMALMKLNNLKRARGSKGKIKYEHLVFPKSFVVAFDNE